MKWILENHLWLEGTFEPDELGPNQELPRISPLCFDLGSDHQSRDREQQVGSFGADLVTTRPG